MVPTVKGFVRARPVLFFSPMNYTLYRRISTQNKWLSKMSARYFDMPLWKRATLGAAYGAWIGFGGWLNMTFGIVAYAVLLECLSKTEIQNLE